MRLNLLSEDKYVSAGSLFHVLIIMITRSQKKVVRIFRLFDFLNNLYLWPLVCVTVENSKRSFVLTTTRPKQFYNTISGQLIVCDVLGFVSLSTVV